MQACMHAAAHRHAGEEARRHARPRRRASQTGCGDGARTRPASLRRVLLLSSSPSPPAPGLQPPAPGLPACHPQLPIRTSPRPTCSASALAFSWSSCTCRSALSAAEAVAAPLAETSSRLSACRQAGGRQEWRWWLVMSGSWGSARKVGGVASPATVAHALSVRARGCIPCAVVPPPTPLPNTPTHSLSPPPEPPFPQVHPPVDSPRLL